MFEHFAARAKQRSIRIKFASKCDKIAFVSTGAMQKQECAVRSAGNEFVNEVRDHCLAAVSHYPRYEAFRLLMLSIIFPRQSNVAIPLVTFLSATAESGVSLLAWGTAPGSG